MKRIWILAVMLSACGTGERYEQMRLEGRIDQAVSAYEAARLKADPLDLCVKARLVAIAYDDAGRPSQRDAWKAKEAADCRLAHARMAGGAEMAGWAPTDPLIPAEAGTQIGGR